MLEVAKNYLLPLEVAKEGSEFFKELKESDLMILDCSGNSNQVFKFHLNMGSGKLSKK